MCFTHSLYSAALSQAFSLHVLPGSFNPPHDGHACMMSAALRVQAPLRSPPSSSDSLGIFEMSVVNVDKPPPPLPAVVQRVLRCLAPQSPLRHSAILITQSPRFFEKSAVLHPFLRALTWCHALCSAHGRQLHLRNWLRHLSTVATEQVLLGFRTRFGFDAAAG